ncbi:MAG: hypothetical protein S4CHLAM81_11010 [Chlamydiales bacterium]|nr:hypothetical protein [Chlamydiales bacterium]MCH9635879.1 hypothetical protein [Chlamydiales bacterium]MCH9704395.1 phage holin family protein [Chlamydiota bacterium]
MIKFLLNTVAIFLTSLWLPGVTIDSFRTALLVALVLGAVNSVVRPIIFILTLPINIMTLGLLSFVIMGACVSLVSKIIPGFVITSFVWTIPFAFVVSLLNWAFTKLFVKKVRI